MTEEANKELYETIKPKYKVPVLTFEEFLKNEAEIGDAKIRGPIKIRKEDFEKLDEYLKRR